MSNVVVTDTLKFIGDGLKYLQDGNHLLPLSV